MVLSDKVNLGLRPFSGFMEYVKSRCEETDFTKSKRKELDELFANPVRMDAE